MFYIGDLFQWERFITPSIIKLFYWLVVIMVVLAGLSGLAAAAGIFFINPIASPRNVGGKRSDSFSVVEGNSTFPALPG